MNTDVSKDLVRETKNKYFRNWRKQNPLKVKQAQQKYWQKRAEQEHQNSQQ